MKALRLLSGDRGADVGTVTIRDGSLEISVADKELAEKIREIARKPLPYLRDEGAVEKTVRAVATPGTEEHLKVLMFELRKLGLESRVLPE